MAKRPKLENLAKQYLSTLQEIRDETRGYLKVLDDLVFSPGGDSTATEPYHALVKSLISIAESSELASRLRQINQLLASSLEGPNDINYNQAKKFLENLDKKAGRKIASQREYSSRISAAVRFGNVKAKKAGKKIVAVDENDLIRYAGDLETPRKKAHKIEYISTREASDILRREESNRGYKVPTLGAYWHRINRRIKSGELPYTKVNGRLKVDKDAFDNMMPDLISKKERTAKQPKPPKKQSRFPEVVKAMQGRSMDYLRKVIREELGMTGTQANGYERAYILNLRKYR